MEEHKEASREECKKGWCTRTVRENQKFTRGKFRRANKKSRKEDKVFRYTSRLSNLEKLKNRRKTSSIRKRKEKPNNNICNHLSLNPGVA